MFKHRKYSRIFCPQRPRFWTLEKFRPDCFCVYPTCERQPDFIPMPQMPQISEGQSTLLYMRRHFTRYTITKWNATNQVTRSLYCHNKVWPWDDPVLLLQTTLYNSKVRNVYQIWPHYRSHGRQEPATYFGFQSVPLYHPYVLSHTDSCMAK